MMRNLIPLGITWYRKAQPAIAKARLNPTEPRTLIKTYSILEIP